jgi:polyisoprenoid-binding protein YceI
MTSPTATVPGLVAGTWTIDPSHSEVGFVVRHLMVSKVRGLFEKFTGTLTVGTDVLTSSVEAVVDMTSITTRDENRDNHLRTADFFETEKHPEMTFSSTSITPKGDNFVLTGDLTIKGITKPTAFDLEFNGVSSSPMGTRAGFTANTEISRSEFGVDINMPLDGGGAVIGDKVKIQLEVEAILQEG